MRSKAYPNYEQTIERLHKNFNDYSFFKKFLCTITGTYSSKLKKRIEQLYNEIHTKKTSPIKQNTSNPTQKKTAAKNLLSDSEVAEYEELKSVYQQYTPLLATAIEQRIKIHNQIKNDKNNYSLRTYQLNNQTIQLLRDNDHDAKQFTQCSGNELQHAIHQESLNILEHVSSLPSDSVLYIHQNALVDCTASICELNNEGLVDKATLVADFCWTLLDYGQAIVEGAALGLYSTAQDIVDHPIEATLCIVASKEVLAYQLCKILYNVADIGLTAITDRSHAKEKWNDYIEPINNLIAAIENKEITLRDSIKMGTAFVIGYKAQSKLLGGLGKFCRTIKQSATRFAQNNISSFAVQQYLSTPEGYLLRGIAKSSCPAPCPNQYEHLKQWLRIKEFTSVIDATKHGIERLIERGFTPEEVYETINFPNLTHIQKDGAIAYIKQIENRFNVIIFNKQIKKVITVIKNADFTSLNKLGKKYGWR